MVVSFRIQFRWTAGLIVVTNSFLTGTKNDKYGSDLYLQATGTQNQRLALQVVITKQS